MFLISFSENILFSLYGRQGGEGRKERQRVKKRKEEILGWEKMLLKDALGVFFAPDVSTTQRVCLEIRGVRMQRPHIQARREAAYGGLKTAFARTSQDSKHAESSSRRSESCIAPRSRSLSCTPEKHAAQPTVFVNERQAL